MIKKENGSNADSTILIMENKVIDLVQETNHSEENDCNHTTKLLIEQKELEAKMNSKEDNNCNHDTKLLVKENGTKKDEDEIEFESRPTSAERWRKAKDDIIKDKMSWKWIMDEVSDEIESVPHDDGCCKWIKRFLTIGNIGVIMACFCLLIASFVVCFKK